MEDYAFAGVGRTICWREGRKKETRDIGLYVLLFKEAQIPRKRYLLFHIHFQCLVPIFEGLYESFSHWKVHFHALECLQRADQRFGSAHFVSECPCRLYLPSYHPMALDVLANKVIRGIMRCPFHVLIV